MEYRYTSTEERVYADRGLVVTFGETADWPDGPPTDGHWVPTDETQAELDRLAAERAAVEAAQAKTADPPQTGEQSTETPPGETGPTDTPTTPAPASGRNTTKE